VTDFDPERFEEKYVHYMDELQTAYRNAFEHLHGRYDSRVLRAIDRQVLDGSEPFYEGDGEFRVELPENPRERVGDLPVDEATFDTVLEEFTDRIELELARVFGLESGE
jgi:hypothetical protein